MIYRFVEKPHHSSSSVAGLTTDLNGAIPYRYIEYYVTRRLYQLAMQDDLVFEFGSGRDRTDPGLPEAYGPTVYLHDLRSVLSEIENMES
ncbi:TPA_asm: hypothetical protein [ssRNA phage SRR5466338_3]|uniref:Uncharacterized protein n=1 Tax=ssRNA phage SRR5466338_3 TaxID=2786392 RepID=A0A8S5KZP9_9VIRU|nr:hypothetical protein QIL07_gp1 [ssRNA phage SRR5466338_3]DAD50784.1 TPA_asm: hypothetical protein [ssRNA phage SRR5466338_3]